MHYRIKIEDTEFDLICIGKKSYKVETPDEIDLIYCGGEGIWFNGTRTGALVTI